LQVCAKPADFCGCVSELAEWLYPSSHPCA
jgi:hypothetical protein